MYVQKGSYPTMFRHLLRNVVNDLTANRLQQAVVTANEGDRFYIGMYGYPTESNQASFTVRVASLRSGPEQCSGGQVCNLATGQCSASSALVLSLPLLLAALFVSFRFLSV